MYSQNWKEEVLTRAYRARRAITCANVTSNLKNIATGAAGAKVLKGKVLPANILAMNCFEIANLQPNSPNCVTTESGKAKFSTQFTYNLV